jgi:hypothetical protein
MAQPSIRSRMRPLSCRTRRVDPRALSSVRISALRSASAARRSVPTSSTRLSSRKVAGSPADSSDRQSGLGHSLCGPCGRGCGRSPSCERARWNVSRIDPRTFQRRRRCGDRRLELLPLCTGSVFEDARVRRGERHDLLEAIEPFHIAEFGLHPQGRERFSTEVCGNAFVYFDAVVGGPSTGKCRASGMPCCEYHMEGVNCATH